jgi:hypothetical protein
VDNGNGTFTYTDEDGNATTFDSKIATVADNLDGTYTITDDFGTSVTIDTNNTVTTLVDNGDGSFTYTSEDGTITTFTETTSTLVDNTDGTYTYTDETGATQNIDTNASSNPYDGTTSGLSATDVQAAIDEVVAGSSDDQTASEVNSDTPVDMDGDGNTEATVEDVIQDIAPITSKAARIFYPPSIAIDASTNGTGFTVDLHAQYIAQFGAPAAASAGAPAAVPTYAATDLYYYVTYADPAVFANMSIDANGVLTYDIIGQPADYNSLINVVFVVK